MKDVILTPEGYKQLKAGLEVLTTQTQREIAERIAAAREFGEIAENAEYDDAKNEQMMLEHRIAQLEERLANAQLIDKRRSTRASFRSVPSSACATSMRRRRPSTSSSAPPRRTTERKLSNESPVGKAIMGRKKGETVEVVTPRGSR